MSPFKHLQYSLSSVYLANQSGLQWWMYYLTFKVNNKYTLSCLIIFHVFHSFMSEGVAVMLANQNCSFWQLPSQYFRCVTFIFMKWLSVNTQKDKDCYKGNKYPCAMCMLAKRDNTVWHRHSFYSHKQQNATKWCSSKRSWVLERHAHGQTDSSSEIKYNSQA